MDSKDSESTNKAKVFGRRALKVLYPLISSTLWLLGILGLLCMTGLPLVLLWILFAAFIGVWIWKQRPKPMGIAGLSSFVLMLIFYFLQQARDDRDWWLETSRLPSFEISADNLTIHELRNFTWRSLEDYDSHWESRSYDLSKLNSLDLIVEPFRDSELMAHTMFSFGFSDGQRVIVSAEARKEANEDYGLLPGAFRQFELMYIFGSEEDLLTLRAVGRGARIYSYPVKATPEFIQDLFMNMVESAESLHEKPRFYASLRQNCTTTLVQHIDELRPKEKKLGLRSETLFPAKSGALLHAIGKMDTDLSFEEARKRYRIDVKAREFVGDENFSEKIRE